MTAPRGRRGGWGRWFVLAFVVACSAWCLRGPATEPDAGTLACPTATAPLVFVDTPRHRLTLCESGIARETFRVRLGHGGVGKRAEGDGKTPLGAFALGWPRASVSFGTFIPVGYPTEEQRREGYTGGAIGVHGPHRWARWLGTHVNDFDSTDGCVGVATDEEMDRIAAWVREKGVTTVVIR